MSVHAARRERPGPSPDHRAEDSNTDISAPSKVLPANDDLSQRRPALVDRQALCLGAFWTRVRMYGSSENTEGNGYGYERRTAAAVDPIRSVRDGRMRGWSDGLLGRDARAGDGRERRAVLRLAFHGTLGRRLRRCRRAYLARRVERYPIATVGSVGKISDAQ